MLRRFGPQALVVLLIVSTGVAFAVTEHLKLERSPITHTLVTKVFSPDCGCATERASIVFRLRRRERVTVSIIGAHDREIVRLLDHMIKPAGDLRIVWNGSGEKGKRVPDGRYRVRVQLALERRTITLPNVIVLDTSPPKITLVGARPRTFSPDRDHRADAVHLEFKLSKGARALLYADGRLVTRARLSSRKIDWHGKIAGRLRLGVHRLTLRAVDRAGNVSKPTAPVTVEVRILKLIPMRVNIGAGEPFSVAVSTDRKLVRWRFAGKTGLTARRRLFLRAPSVPGQYWLLVRSGSYGAGARVMVS